MTENTTTTKGVATPETLAMKTPKPKRDRAWFAAINAEIDKEEEEEERKKRLSLYAKRKVTAFPDHDGNPPPHAA